MSAQTPAVDIVFIQPGPALEELTVYLEGAFVNKLRLGIKSQGVGGN